MSSPVNTIEKQQLHRAVGLLIGNSSLRDEGERLPTTLRQLGLCHTLMKYHKDCRALYTVLVDEIRIFDSTLLPVGPAPGVLQVIQNLNSLPHRTDIMLFEHMFSFCEEFRKVAKVMG